LAVQRAVGGAACILFTGGRRVAAQIKVCIAVLVADTGCSSTLATEWVYGVECSVGTRLHRCGRARTVVGVAKRVGSTASRGPTQTVHCIRL